LIDKGKDPELVELDAPASQLHKGDVMSLIYAKIDGLDVLISGSADRTIKLWEPKNAVKASATPGGPKP
jgi:WD40 repeat protein